MSLISKIIIVSFIILDVFILIYLMIGGNTVALLQPKGIIAKQQIDLILFAIFLMLTLAIPTVIFAFYTVARFNSSNKKGGYDPEWDNKIFRYGRWILPCFIVFILSVVTWNTAHRLDPHVPIQSANNPIKIQVVALEWKWLFIYPEQNIATVNFVQFPQNTPVTFELTADGLMNSFWIPQLGGQMYAMGGMVNPLHLMADTTGEFDGSAAEINGIGYAHMRFKAKSTTTEEFETWVSTVKNSNKKLDTSVYHELALPSENNSADFYSSVDPKLFHTIVNKYMAPTGTNLGEREDH